MIYETRRPTFSSEHSGSFLIPSLWHLSDKCSNYNGFKNIPSFRSIKSVILEVSTCRNTHHKMYGFSVHFQKESITDGKSFSNTPLRIVSMKTFNVQVLPNRLFISLKSLMHYSQAYQCSAVLQISFPTELSPLQWRN